MKRAVYILPIVLLIALAVLSVIKLGQVGGPQSDLFQGKARAAPAIELSTLEEGTYKLSEHLGEPVVVNVWATWCLPCKLEHPYLMEMSAQTPIVGIAYKDQPTAIVKMLEEDGNPFTTVGLDTDGMAGLSLGVNAVPETFLIDAEGMIVRQHRGPLSREEADAFKADYEQLKAAVTSN